MSVSAEVNMIQETNQSSWRRQETETPGAPRKELSLAYALTLAQGSSARTLPTRLQDKKFLT